MTLFDTRNVLDRIEATGKLFFGSEWKKFLLPQILGGVLMMAIGVFFFFQMGRYAPNLEQIFSSTTHTQNELYSIIIFAVYALLGVTMFITIAGLISTYAFTFCHENSVDMRWQDILKKAYKRLWGWMWYGLWLSIFIAIFLIFPIIIGFIYGGYMWILTGIGAVFVFWGSVALNAGSPGFILENRWSVGEFFSLLKLSRGRWWRIFGNMALVGIVINSVLSLFQQFIFSLMLDPQFLEVFGGTVTNSETFIAMVASGPLYIWLKIASLGTLAIILSLGQMIFTNTFYYIVWRDLTTEVPTAEENKEV